ncbi:PGPGW domain-containing protein [Nocardioides dongkuii]|uniref:PGPGW domain-containing protein n=1 Tax=Nocardioides dongkuii TaxID=2760089 RepID=UPI0015FE7220|nr:PGPGW domain-containing protein [Nocardioides dongkuii]
MKGAARRVVIEVVGWVLVVAGVAALVLPGPGLLMIFGGVAVLSQQYEWAEKRLDPIKYRALKGAAESVATWLRIGFSSAVALGLLACGVVWIRRPDAPSWWAFADAWWLPGGIATGITQIASGILALGLLAWSYRRFHGNPAAVRELEQDIDEADEEFRDLRS